MDRETDRTAVIVAALTSFCASFFVASILLNDDGAPEVEAPPVTTVEPVTETPFGETPELQSAMVETERAEAEESTAPPVSAAPPEEQIAHAAPSYAALATLRELGVRCRDGSSCGMGGK